MTQLNFSDCQYKGPSILEGKFADLGRVQPQNPLQPLFGPQPEGKVYTPEQKQAMDAALEEYGINYRGDPAGTRYVGGSPDFDETTGKFRTTPLPYYEQVERTLRMKIGNDKVDQLLGKLWHLCRGIFPRWRRPRFLIRIGLPIGSIGDFLRIWLRLLFRHESMQNAYIRWNS